MTKTLVKTDKQKEAIRLIGNNKTTLLEGGGRSGKTFIALYAIVIRALLKSSRHLVCRFRFSHAKQAICYDTMLKLLQMLGLKDKVILNKTDWFYEFPNGSTIWVGGLDDKERTEKILGNEYATIYLNEASQISFESFEILITRLNPPQGMKGKILIDYNPPSIRHWGYTIFHKREFPDGRPVPENDFVWLKMNPGDNPNNSPEYIETLMNLSVSKRKRFLEGEYSLDSGSLWKRAWIKYNDNVDGFWRVVVGVDPSGTTTGDEIGIVVTAMKDNQFWILDDFSCHGTPAQWAAEVSAAYEKWKADVVVAEKNYGGDMVLSTLQNANEGMNVKLVTSSRGKVLRAEPISALYEQGKVYHRTMFNDLEDEMCIFEQNSDFSPNRLDAMVFGLTELSGESISMLDVV